MYSSTTRHTKRSASRHLPPSVRKFIVLHMEQKLKKRYAEQLAQLEYEMFVSNTTEGLDDNALRCRRYFLSSSNRRAFGLTVCRNHYTKNFATVLGTAKQVGISRNAAEKIAADCEGEDYITFRRCQNNYRWIEARPLILECWEMYAERVRSYSNEIDFASTTFAIRGIQALTS